MVQILDDVDHRFLVSSMAALALMHQPLIMEFSEPYPNFVKVSYMHSASPFESILCHSIKIHILSRLEYISINLSCCIWHPVSMVPMHLKRGMSCRSDTSNFNCTCNLFLMCIPSRTWIGWPDSCFWYHHLCPCPSMSTLKSCRRNLNILRSASKMFIYLFI